MGGQFDVMDMLSVMSFLLGLENLQENRQQSAQNDVNAANDKQAKRILFEIGKRLDKQDGMLKEILEEINRKNAARTRIKKSKCTQGEVAKWTHVKLSWKLNT